MLNIKVPGGKDFSFDHLILDFNGTIAFNGKLIDGVGDRVKQLAQFLTIHVVTADTNGSVHKECEGLPITVNVIGKENQLQEKKEFVKGLQSVNSIAMGNGVNDELMFEVSDLAIAIVGKEGVAVSSMLKADIVVTDIIDALDLLLNENRLVATLRK